MLKEAGAGGEALEQDVEGGVRRCGRLSSGDKHSVGKDGRFGQAGAQQGGARGGGAMGAEEEPAGVEPEQQASDG